jgi:hypothetical protein
MAWRGASPGIGQAGSGSQVAGPAASAASWRPPAHPLGGRLGWSPNSCAIRLTQPRVPNRRTARLIAAATLSTLGPADRCSAEANNASNHASSTFNRVLAVLPAVDVLAGEGTGSPGARALRWAKRTGDPSMSRTCVWMDVLDEVVMVSLLTTPAGAGLSARHLVGVRVSHREVTVGVEETQVGSVDAELDLVPRSDPATGVDPCGLH